MSDNNTLEDVLSTIQEEKTRTFIDSLIDFEFDDDKLLEEFEKKTKIQTEIENYLSDRFKDQIEPVEFLKKILRMF